ncbi:hypothetical protein L3Y34_009506 [Caenorhabditis briggsae]|uniref:Uncharacterized protein n=1 Tax=Caenorhabditis briggsae TaxID=6238 RepID=A0AAE9A4B5_CAEBR|nr:hypothetical protein L3Y34_009506 [Caenorhabditis briggsae]
MGVVDLYVMQVSDKDVAFMVTDDGKMCIHDAPDVAKETLKKWDPANEVHIFPRDLNKRKNRSGRNRKMGAKKGNNFKDKDIALGTVVKKLLDKKEAYESNLAAKRNTMHKNSAPQKKESAEPKTMPTVDEDLEREKEFVKEIFMPLVRNVLGQNEERESAERRKEEIIKLEAKLMKCQPNRNNKHWITLFFVLLILAPIYIPVICFYGAPIFEVINGHFKEIFV